MEVDQKHITTIRMHDAKGSDIQMVKDGDDYHLKLCSNNNVVHISLGYADVKKLCQQVVQLDMEENMKHYFMPPPDMKSFFFNGGPKSYQETLAQWYARMAGDDSPL